MEDGTCKKLKETLDYLFEMRLNNIDYLMMKIRFYSSKTVNA